MIYSLSVAARPEGSRVSLTGEVDMSVSDHLYDALRDALDRTRGTVEVNLRGLRMLDCTGITTLLRAHDDAVRGGRVLFVSQPRGVVRLVLGLTGTLAVLTADTPLQSSAPAADHHHQLVDEAEALQNLPDAARPSAGSG